MLRACLLVLALAACRKPTPESTLPPKASPKQCEQVADHLVGLLMANLERNAAVNETADAIRKAIGDRCLTDGWGPDATDCYSRLQSLGGGSGKQPCEEFLSIDQRNNIDKAIAEVFDGPSGGSAAPPGSGS